MKLIKAQQKLEQVVTTTGSPDAGPTELKEALQAASEVESFLMSQRAELVRSIAASPTSFPEAAIADTAGCSLNAATKETERANTLGAAMAVDEALSDGHITAGHVDALTRATRNLDEAATTALFGNDEAIADAASTRSIAEFDKWVTAKAKALDTSNGEERLDQQRRSTRLSTWVDGDGMYNLKGRFDPDTGRKLAHHISARTTSKFVEKTPDTAPTHPLERKQHLEALALTDLILGDVARSAGAAPIVVIDATQANGAGGPTLDWGLPIELPDSVLAEVFDIHDPEVVVVSNGVILHAPGQLNHGRAKRLASPEQRRALAGLYSTCGVPGCSVHYDRCKLHHIIEWEHGGLTDLANLFPACQHHHTRIHKDGWTIELGPNRELTIRLPDGQTMRTGPPKRSAA